MSLIHIIEVIFGIGMVYRLYNLIGKKIDEMHGDLGRRIDTMFCPEKEVQVQREALMLSNKFIREFLKRKDPPEED